VVFPSIGLVFGLGFVSVLALGGRTAWVWFLSWQHKDPAELEKLRRLEITAGARKNTRQAAGVWSTNAMMRQAERELAQQAEASYKRMVQDQQAGAPARKAGASMNTGARIIKALEGQAARQARELQTPALRHVIGSRPPTT